MLGLAEGLTYIHPSFFFVISNVLNDDKAKLPPPVSNFVLPGQELVNL